jgi:hypothetical protein
MGFIAGHLTRNGKVSCAEIERTLQSYRILSEDDLNDYENLVIQTRFGCVVRKYKKNYPVQFKPYHDENGTTVLILGFLSSTERLLSPKQLEQCEGEFVAVFSEQSGKLHIINDRFGSRPFYILRNGDDVYFSSNFDFLLQLAGGSPEADILGWFHMFSYGHTFGSRTTLRDVKRLLPATHLTISQDGTVEEKRYWRLAYLPAAGLDPVSYSKEVFDAFREGARLRSRLCGKGVVALSGGLDSRLVAAALPDDVEFSEFTFLNSSEGTSSADTEVAAQVCNALGLHHRVEPIASQAYSAVAEGVIRLIGGMRPLHHCAIVMPYVRELKRLGLNFLLGGGPGDVSAGSKIPSVEYLDPRRTDKCVRDFCRSLASGAEYLGLIFRDKFINEYHWEVYPSLVESFGDISGPTAAHKITAWELLNRWPAFTFTSVMHNHPDVSEAFCHLDYKYTDLMLMLPAQWLYQRNFYSFMIYHNLPKLRHVPYANTGQPLSGELQEFEYQHLKRVSFAAHVAKKVIPRKIKRLLRPISRDTLPFYYCLYRDDERLFADMRECLYSLSSLREILDFSKCLRFLDDFQTDNLKGLSYDRQTELVGGLATMCLTFKGLPTAGRYQVNAH